MISSKRALLLFCLIGIVLFLGLLCPLMEYDSNQFAVMSMKMYLENNFIDLVKGTEEYLDKPHMHFWLAALSYKIFGLHDWAYRIPAVLASILAAYSCFGLGRLLYNKNVGIIAALMFLTAQTIVLANIDVRTDAVLTGFTVFSIWQLAMYVETRKLLPIVLGAFGAAIAFSTKGQIAIVVIGICLFCHLLYTRKWNVLWNWKVLAALATFAICIAPMLYAYYHQFDLHPEKVIRGRDHRSGIFFILWEQSFERLTGDGMGKNSSDYFFFFHTVLWEFLPWTLIMIGAIGTRFKRIVKDRFTYTPGYDFLTVGGIAIIFILISFAQFKLPHYLNITIPLFAVLTASYLYRIYETGKLKTLVIFLRSQCVITSILVIMAVLLLFLVFGLPPWYIVVLFALVLMLFVYFMMKKEETLSKLITITVVASVLVNIVMNAHFYPKLLNYQAGSTIAREINTQGINPVTVYKVGTLATWALDFYTQHLTPSLSIDEIEEKLALSDSNDPIWLYVDEPNLQRIKEEGIPIKETIKAASFRITKLTFKFVNPNTREAQLKYQYLVRVR